MAEYLNEITYESLRQDIMLLKLQPGTALSTARVAQEYNVSRTPAREALLKLHQIGLVDMFPKSKTVVSRINIPRLHQEWFVRKSLELSVIDDFLTNCAQRDLMELQEIIARQERYAREGSFEPYFEWDRAFHKKIFAVAGQQLAWNVVTDISCHYNRLRAVVMRGEQAQREAIDEHRHILRAMEQRSAPLMRKLMAAHTEKIRTQQKEVYARHPEYFTAANLL